MAKQTRLKRAVIKEELVAITGNATAAIILNQFLYWTERMRSVDEYIKEESERMRSNSGAIGNVSFTHGWIYKKSEELVEEIMLDISPTTARKYVNQLIELSFLQQRTNPEHRWDKTIQYRVDILAVRQALAKLGYSLEGYGSFLGSDESGANSLDKDPCDENQNQGYRTQNFGVRSQETGVRVSKNLGAIPDITTETTTEREIPAPAQKQTPPAQQAPSLSLPPSGQPKQAVMTSDPFTAVSPSTAKLVGQPKHFTGFTSTWDNAPEQQEARALAKIYTGRPEDYLPIAEYLVTLQDCDLGRSELAQLNNTLAAHCVAVSNAKRLEYAVELHKMGATPEQVDSTIKFGAPLRGRTRELHSKAVPSMMQSVLQQNQTPAMSQAAVVYDQFVAPLKELHHSEMTKAYWNLPENAREIIQAVLGRLNSTYLAAAVGLERNRFIQLAAC